MILIDRNALHQTYMRWFKKESVNNQTVTKAITLADALMKNEPVIEAIPIDWIRKWAGRNVAETDNCNWNTYTLRLLESWEEENDVSRIGK